MLRSIAAKTVWDQRRALLWWVLGLAVLVAITVASYPAVRDAPDVNQLFEDMPEALKALIGETEIVSPAGYLNSQLFTFVLPIIFLIYAVTLGAGAVAGEEERGTLDLLLSYPVSRPRVVLQKFAGMALVLLAFCVALWLMLWAGALAVNMEISAGRLVAVTVSLALLTLLFAAFALMLGCLTGRRTLSLGISASVALGAYLLNSLGTLADWLEPTRRLSPFYYFIDADPLRNGLNPAHAAILLAASIILVAVSVPVFQRRDIAV
jgi:ABC-2 type transport system permease protein